MADNALELAASVIKEFEGLRLESYKDSAGIATIGYGATRIDGKPVKMGMKIDRDKAEALLRADLLRFYRAVLSLVTVPLTDGMLVALTSFAFNVGVGELKSSTLLRRLNAGNYRAAADELLRWDKAKDPKTGELRTLAGLTRRRQAERELFLVESVESPASTPNGHHP